MVQNKRKNGGITLVALVITIIILLILAGISIFALGNQGVIKKAKEAKQKTENAEKEESEILENYLAQMNSITFSNVDKTNTNPEEAMPKGAVVIEGDANKGIVIKDNNDNEWAWVEVPKTTVFKTAIKEDDYEKIKNDLIEYAKDYRKGAAGQNLNWSDEWYDGCGMSNDEYNTAYKKMLSSVYTNGGFWISRYEIGDSTVTASSNPKRTRNSGITGVAVSKPNQIPYNYVTCEQAQTLAKGMSADSSKTSSLLFGIQWDLTCKYLETKTELKTEDIKTDSTSWGNYKNSSLKLYRGKYNIKPIEESSIWNAFNEDTTYYVKDSITSNDENYMQLLTTGASEQTNKMNIYDLAGNEWEWTLENALGTKNVCSSRGGCYNNAGGPMSSGYSNEKNASGCHIGFRSMLY